MIMYRRNKTIFSLLLPGMILILLFLCVLPAFAAGETVAKDGHVVLSATLEDLTGKRAAVITGTPHDQMILSSVKDAELFYFNNNTDCLIALREKKVDFYLNNTIQFPFVHEEYPEFTYLDEGIRNLDVGTIFPKKDASLPLLREYNAYLSAIKVDGTLDALKEYWLSPRDWTVPKIPTEGSRGTLHMCTCTSQKPFSFIYNGEHAGYDIALVAGFCRENGYALKIDDADFASMISGIATGKYDLAASQIAWTEERAQKAYYSDFTIQELMVPYVRTADFTDGSGESTTNTSFSDSVESGFFRTFVAENRWKLILGGVGVTLLISVLGFALANLFGALFCAMTLSGNRILCAVADAYSRIMQGTPIVVILMILYYVIFGNSDLSGIAVSIFAFGISTGAYLAQLFAGSIQAIDRGQWEAARTLGMTPARTFLGIILPQAVRSMLPAYFSQFITLMKGTSVVGYIAVMDLTKASDVIRGATYEAFFPLLFSAAIYFSISCLLLSLLKVIRKKLAPRRRTAASKGENNDKN